MTIFQKFGLSFIAALALHFIIIASFGLNTSTETKINTQKPLPEIIKASILDDVKVQQEADKLKAKEDNKRIATIKRQQTLENNRIKEQNLIS